MTLLYIVYFLIWFVSGDGLLLWQWTREFDEMSLGTAIYLSFLGLAGGPTVWILADGIPALYALIPPMKTIYVWKRKV